MARLKLLSFLTLFCANPAAADFSISPAPPFVVESGFGQTRSLEITVTNNGASSSKVGLFTNEASAGDLSGVKTKLEESVSEQILPLLADRFAFDGGETGNSISDGGNDMYDGGNLLSFGEVFSTPLPYSDNEVTTVESGTSEVSYFTRKYDGLFILAADYGSNTTFQISGNLGADGQGSVSLAEFDPGFGYKAYVKTVAGTSDPSVNHLILVPSAPGLSRSASGNTNSDDHIISGLPENGRLYHLLFAKNSGETFPPETIETLAATLLEVARPLPSWLDWENQAGVIAPGGSGTVVLTLDSEGLAQGTYATRLTFAPEETDPATILEADFEDLTFQVAAPDFTVSTNEIEVGAILGSPIDPIRVGVFPNFGVPNLDDLVISTDSPWLNVSPVDEDNAILIAPDSVGAGSASIFLTTASTRQVIKLKFLLSPLNITQLLPDPNRARLYAINQSGKEQGSVLVIDTITKDILKNIPVGLEPTDLALTEDSQELLVMNTSDPSIQRIDLTSLEITTTYALSEFSDRNDDFGGHVVDGPGNIIYYVDEQWGPRLRVFDTSTETVLQTISAVSVDGNNTSNDFGFGDIQITPDQSHIYGWRQYGDGAGVGGSNLVRLTIGPDGRLSDLRTGPSRSAPTFDRAPYDTPVVISGDGSTIIVKDSLIDPSTLLFAGRFPDEIYAITPNAQVVSGAEAIYSINGVDPLFNLPPDSRVQTFLPDYSHFVYFQSGDIHWVNLVDEIGLEDLGISITPEPGSVVAPPPALEWLPISGTTEYEVYLGTNRADVIAGIPTFSNFLGLSPSTSWTLETELTPGVYYWRATPSGVSGGEVHQFTVSPLGLGRPEIDETTVAGVRQLDGSIETSSTTPINWAANSDQPWIQILTPTGSSSEPVHYRLSATNLAAGRYEGNITLTFAGGPLVIPVSLQVQAVNFTHLDSDRERPSVLLISQPDINGYDPAFLIEADGNTGELLRAVPCGFSVTDLAIHHAENRIYVPNRNSGILRAFDRDSLEQIQTYQFNPRGSVGSSRGDISGVSAGAFGQLVINEWDQHTAVSLIDTSNGEVLGTTGAYGDGRGVHSPNGQIYYHPVIGTSRAALHKYTLSSDEFTEVAVFEERRYSNPAIISGDGSRLFWGRDVLNEDLESLLTVDDTIVAASFFGDLAFTSTKIYNTRNGEELATLPISSTLQTVSHDQQSLLIVENDSITVFDLTSIIDLPSIEVVPSIPDGSPVIGTNHEVSWSAVSSAISYEVYLGSDRATVDAAGPDDPQFIGSVSQNFLPGGIENLNLGETYFWKIIPIGLSGPGTASIWSFDVFPTDITPREIIVTAPVLSPIAPIQLTLTGPAPWTASVTDPFGHWVSLDKESGEPSDQLVVTLDSGSLLSNEDNSTFITIESGGSSVNIPVTLDLRPLNYVLAKADALNPYLYAISEEDSSPETPAFLLKIDSQTEQIVAAVPCGYDVTDFDIHYQENRIYLTNHEAFQVKAFDLDTLVEEQVYSITPEGIYPRNDPYRVSAGRNGQIMVEGLDQFIDVQLLDTSDGSVLATRSERQGGGVFSADGEFYYHGDSNSSGAVISRHDVNHPNLAELNAIRVAPFSYYGSRRVVISGDGSRVFWNGGVFDQELNLIREVSPGEVISSSFGGEIAVTNTQVINTTNGEILADLPRSNSLQAISRDQEKLFFFEGPSFEVVDLGQIASLPPITLAPSIGDGSIIVGSDHELAWTRVASALSYDIYFGSDAAAVANADRDSDLFLGNTVETFRQGGISGLNRGSTYFWRIDVRGLSKVQAGDVWSFQVAPIDISEQAFDLNIPQGSPRLPKTITLGAAGEENDWSATTADPRLTLDKTGGASGEDLTITLDTAGLDPESYQTEVTITAGGQSFPFPISYRVIALNIVHLHQALEPESVLALSQTPIGDGPSFILEVSSSTNRITRFIEAGQNATDFDLAEDLSLLYLTNNGEENSFVIDLESWELSGEIPLGRSATGIAATTDGTLIIENRGVQRIKTLFRPGSEAPTDLGFSESDPFALGEFSSDGTFYYSSPVYTEFLAFSVAESSLERIEDRRLETARPASTDATLLVSGNGERIFSSHHVFDSERNLVTVLPDVTVATNREGLVAVTPNAIYWALSGQKFVDLPFSTRHAAFSGDDRFLVLYNPENSSFVSFQFPRELPFPQPGQQFAEAPATLSIPAVTGATSYRLYLGTAPDQLTLQTTQEESSFNLSNLPEVFGKVFWRIDVETPSVTLTGLVYDFALVPRSHHIEMSSTPSTVLAREGSLMSSSVNSRDGYVTELPLSDTTTTNVPPSVTYSDPDSFPFGGNPTFGTHVAKAGEKLFSASNGSLFPIEPSGTSGWRRGDPFIPEESPARIYDLEGSGDLLFVSASLNNQTNDGRVLVYRTFPRLAHEATILPPDPSAEGFGENIAAFGNLLAIASRPTRNESVVKIWVYQRDPDRQLWSFQQTLEVAAQRSRPYDLDTDGERIVALTRTSPGDTEVLTIFQRNTAGSFVQEEQLTPSELGFQGFSGVFKVSLDQNLLGIASPFSRSRLDHLGSVFLLEHDGSSWRTKPTLTDPNFEIKQELDITDGSVFASTEAGVSRFDLPGSYNQRPRFTGRPPFQAVEGRQYSAPLTASDESGEVTIIAEQLPSWLSLRRIDGRPTLVGTPNVGNAPQTVRLRATDEEGISAWQTFDLDLVADDALPIFSATPESQSLGAGQFLSLKPVVEGVGPFSFQWFFNGEPIPGENSSVLTRDSITLQDGGAFSLEVTNVVGTVSTDPIEIIVRPANRFAGDWPTFGGSPRRDRHHPASLGTHRFLPAWTAPVHPSRGVQRTAIADGRVFAVPNIRFGGPHEVKAFNLADGTELWSQTFAEANSMNPPSYHDGRVYFQRGNHSSDSQLWALDATNGETIWNAPFSAQWERYEAPAVTDEGIWVNGGSYGGLYGFNLDGTQKFFEGLPQTDNWAPALQNGLVYTMVDGIFTAHNPESGLPIWTLNPDLIVNSSRGATQTPVVTSREAILLGPASTLLCVDLESRQTRWQTEPYDNQTQENDLYYHTPAVFGDTVYAIGANQIIALDLETGTKKFTLETGENITTGQPLILNDFIIAGSQNNTFVYRIEDQELVQVLPVGGFLSYSDGYLNVAGYSGTLHTFFANDIPDITLVTLPEMVEDEPYSVDLGVVHGDDNEDLVYTLRDAPDFISLSQTGEITGLFERDQVTTEYTFTVEVSDGITETVSRQYTLTLVNVNDLPVITPFEIRLIEDGEPFSISIDEIVSDEDTPLSELTISLTQANPLPGGPVFSTSTENGILTLTPLPDRFGTLNGRLQVSEGDEQSVESLIPIEITPVPDPPRLIEAILDLTTNDAGDPISIDLSNHFIDPDPGEILTFSITGNSNPEVISSFAVDGPSLRINFAPYREGASEITVTATDPGGLTFTETFTVTLPALPVPSVQASPQIVLNSRTGLYEQQVTITNSAARAIGGFDLAMTGLTNGYTVYGWPGNTIAYRQPLAAGETLTLVVEFHSPTSRSQPTPTFTTSNSLPEPQPLVTPADSEPDKLHVMPDRSMLLEFASTPGKQYQIQYTQDLETWFASPVLVTANANRTQWADQGLPKTSCHPKDCPMRAYRVVEISGESSE